MVSSTLPLLLLLVAPLVQWAPGVAAAGPGRRCEAVNVDGKYSDRYDNVDVDAILNSARLLKAYVDCMMDRGPCTREGCFLKAVVPDVMQNECAKCNTNQRQIAGKILSFLLQYHREDYWNELLGKYDPSGMFRKRQEWVDEDDEDPDEESDQKA